MLDDEEQWKDEKSTKETQHISTSSKKGEGVKTMQQKKLLICESKLKDVK